MLGQPLELGQPTKPPNGQAVRERLSHLVYCLVVNMQEDGKLLTDEEYEWACESLSWMNWHGGKVGGRNLAEGVLLMDSAPPRAEA